MTVAPATPEVVARVLARYPRCLPRPEPWKDREWLVKQLEKFSARQIAEQCDVERATVLYWARRHGLARQR